jgi:hypothetical protein
MKGRDMKTRLEMAEAIRSAVEAQMANPACHVTGVTLFEDPADPQDSFATFSVHVGGLDAEIFHVHVYKED